MLVPMHAPQPHPPQRQSASKPSTTTVTVTVATTMGPRLADVHPSATPAAPQSLHFALDMVARQLCSTATAPLASQLAPLDSKLS